MRTYICWFSCAPLVILILLCTSMGVAPTVVAFLGTYAWTANCAVQLSIDGASRKTLSGRRSHLPVRNVTVIAPSAFLWPMLPFTPSSRTPVSSGTERGTGLGTEGAPDVHVQRQCWCTPIPVHIVNDGRRNASRSPRRTLQSCLQPVPTHINQTRFNLAPLSFHWRCIYYRTAKISTTSLLD